MPWLLCTVVQTEKVRVDVAVDLEFEDSKWAEILNEFRCVPPRIEGGPTAASAAH
jgi:hypothetical protein